MKTLLTTVPLLLLLTLAALALACAAPPPTPIPTVTPIPTATPDIPSTVTARVAAISTPTAYPTNTPYPTLTPRPTVTPYPTATPRPTYTPYPTSTTVPTTTPNPTNTPYPTYTPYPTPIPTPTPWPTATPRPTPTPVPWTTHRPRTFYSIRTPADWVKAYDGDILVAFDAPDNGASVDIFSHFAEYGWRDGFTVDRGAEIDLSILDDKPGFRILSLWTVSSKVKRSSYRYNGRVGSCDISGYGLHILLTNRSFFVRIEVCDNARWKYDDAFVNRMFDSFTYRER